ncbi:MAG: sulfotransferase family protein [Bacteroidota bacterium]
MKIISLWSGPRNVSTALMYSFAQRIDMTVVDEPLYAHYLQNSDADHIGRDEVIASMANDGDQVMREILSIKTEGHIFLKNMAHHWIGLDDEYLLRMINLFLIRDPKEMLPSLNKQLPQPILRDTALKMQVDIYNYLNERGKAPLVINSKDLLLDPEGMLQMVCDRLSIPCDSHMLGWKAGPRPEDGIWAKYWYHSVHKSEGFSSYQKKEDPFPAHLQPLLEESTPYYEFLNNKALRVKK